jgi:tetratricopeptide (TPR) repeat protein
MRASVLSDPALVKHAGRFAWLSIDTEKARNASFLEKFPINIWPTFLVIDPATEKPVLKWAGTLDVPRLEKLFDDAEIALRTSGSNTPEEALAFADRANAEGRKSEAAKLYLQVLHNAPQDWSGRPRAIQSLVTALAESRAFQECAEEAFNRLPSLSQRAALAYTAGIGLECALNTPKSAPRRSELIAALEPRVVDALSSPDLIADDRGWLYQLLVEAAKARDDKSLAKERALEWLAFLDREAAKSQTAEARASLDSYRVSAAIESGDPARAIPALEASERDLPRDYNPPLRLASVYTRLGKYDQALRAADRAMSKVYGPRKLNVYETKANIYLKKGDRQSAVRVLEEGLRAAESLPKAQRSEKAVARLQASLDQARGAATAQTH